MSKQPRARPTAVATAPTGVETAAWSALLDSGDPVPVGGNQPLEMDDDRLAWVVRSGPLHVFAVARRRTEASGPEESPGARVPLFTVGDGELLLGTGRPGVEAGLQLVASGGPEAAVVQVAADRLLALAANPEVGGRLEGWVERMTGAVASQPGPRDAAAVQAGEQTPREGAALRGSTGMVWLRVLAGSALFEGSEALQVTPEQPAFPLAAAGWLVAGSGLSGVFSLFSFALLFFTLRALNVVQNRLAGTTLQFLTGIPKIRIAGAEPRAFEVWARQQAEQSRLSSRAQYTTIRVNVILGVARWRRPC